MCAWVRTEQLIDTHAVAELLGLRHANSVSLYLRRYRDMPRPVLDLGDGRPRLWLRPQVRRWLRDRRARRKRASAVGRVNTVDGAGR